MVHSARLLALIATLFVAVSSAAAQRPSAPTLHYDADVRIVPDSAWIDAQVTLRYTVPSEHRTGVALILNRGLTVQALAGAQVRSHTVQPSTRAPSWQELLVTFVDGVSAGDTVTITLGYRGRPEMPDDGINRITPAWVELGIDSQWFPILDTFAQFMTGDVRIQLPSSWTVVGSGSHSFENGRHLLRNRVEQIDVAFTASPRVQNARQAGAEVYHRTISPDAVQAVLAAATTCAREMNARFGPSEPFPVARVVLAERDGPGYARKNYIVLSTVNADSTEALQRFLCHEVAHFWTRSPGAFTPDHWMSEAFAEYAAAMVVRATFGDEAFARLRRGWVNAGASSGPVWTPASTQRPSFALMYRRAPALLAELEARIGRDRFATLIARYMVDGITSTAALLELVSAIGGVEAAAWFASALAE